MSETARNTNLDHVVTCPDEVSFSSSEFSLSVDPTSVPSSELQHSFRRLTLLYELAHQICGETDEGRVFNRILSAVVESLNIERAFIAVFLDGNLAASLAFRTHCGPCVAISRFFIAWRASPASRAASFEPSVAARSKSAMPLLGLAQEQFAEIGIDSLTGISA